MRADHEADFVAFVEVAIPSLRRLARSATPDPHRADDLVQTTLEKLYLVWPRLTRRGEVPLAYARTTLVRTLISEERRVWRTRERSTEQLPAVAVSDGSEAISARMDVTAALHRLPPRQRLVLFLRHYEDLSVAQTANVMGCSEGTVKSTTSDALCALRRELKEVGPRA